MENTIEKENKYMWKDTKKEMKPKNEEEKRKRKTKTKNEERNKKFSIIEKAKKIKTNNYKHLPA